MQQFGTSPCALGTSLWQYRALLGAMVKREVIGRYRGSVIGIAWSFFNPLLMLVVYTFVFSVVFKARWGIGVEESKTDFGIILFVGIIFHGFFAECVNRAPTLVLANPNYVKKVIFPLEILPWVALGSALFHAAVSLIVFFAVQALVGGGIPWTAVLLPFILLPLILVTIGLSWFLAALGVYIRDIGQMTTIFTTVMMFVSPVFYPIAALPAEYHTLLRLNPLATIIEDGRMALIFGRVPEVSPWATAMLVGATMAWAGFAWFQKSRKGFADVI